MTYPKLNLPPAQLRIHEDKVWDAVRGAWLVLTPEEWVRQHWLAYLVSEKGVEPHRIAREVSIPGASRQRADIVVYDRAARAVLVVECKAATIRITQEVFDQVARYNMELRASLLVVSNGLQHYCCEIDHTTKSYKFIPEIPSDL